MTKGWSLRSLLTLQLGFISLLPLLLVGALMLRLLHPQVARETGYQQQTVARLVASQVETSLRDSASQLELLANLITTDVRDDASLVLQLERFAELNSAFGIIYLTNAQGQVRMVGLPAPVRGLRQNFLGIDMSQKAFVRQANETGVSQWSDASLSAVSGRLSVAYAIPTHAGILIGEIAIDRLPALLQRASPDRALTLMILDQQGQLLAHTDASLSGQQLNLSNLPLAQSMPGTVMSAVYDLDGERWSGSAVAMRFPDWRVIVAQPQTVAGHLANTTNVILLTSLIAGLLVAVLTALVTSRGLAFRFDVYANIIRGLSAGEYRFRQPHSMVREFQALSANLEETAAAIRQREEALAETNARLELHVAERTGDLTRANEELRNALRNLTRAQSELVQSEKLAALGSMVAGIAHELNTPIGVGVTASSSVAEQTRSFTAIYEQGEVTRTALEAYLEDVRHGADVVLRNLNRAAELISSFKQVAVDQTSSLRRDFMLHQTVQEVLLTLRPVLKRTPHKIEVSIPEGILMDSYPGPLGQILTNLINNAIVHGFEDRHSGTLQISARTLNADEVELVVQDNGAGISPENLDRIYDPFFTTRLGKGGSGLGMHIVHNMVTNVLKGSVSVSSTPGKGTTVTLRLPRHPA